MAFWCLQAFKLKINTPKPVQLLNKLGNSTHRNRTLKKAIYLPGTSHTSKDIVKLYHTFIFKNGLIKPTSFASRSKGFSGKLLNNAVTAYCNNTRNGSDSTDKANKRTDVTYEELVDLVACGDVLLIDVREPKEIEQTGLMPGAVNIPITKLKNSLSMTEEKYQHEYKLPKPTGLGEKIIFYGFSNIKSEAALELAHKANFKKARHFPGGWKEWSKKQGGGDK